MKNLNYNSFFQFFFYNFKKYFFKVIKNENSSWFFYINDFFLVFISSQLKKNIILSFDILNNISVVDCIQKINRYELFYLFTNIKMALKIFLVLQIKINFFNPFSYGIFSLNKIFKSALQLEREIYDMFGLYFYNHKDLRRLLTDYGFKGFPLRKEFPLTGFYELRYDEINNIIIINELRLVQNFRIFDFINPQEN